MVDVRNEVMKYVSFLVRVNTQRSKFGGNKSKSYIYHSIAGIMYVPGIVVHVFIRVYPQFVRVESTALLVLRVFAKIRYTWSLWCQVQITRQEPCDWPASHRTCFWLEKGQEHLVLSSLCSFQLFLGNFEPIRGHTLVPRHVSYDVL